MSRGSSSSESDWLSWGEGFGLGLVRRLEADAEAFGLREWSELSALAASNLRLFLFLRLDETAVSISLSSSSVCSRTDLQADLGFGCAVDSSLRASSPSEDRSNSKSDCDSWGGGVGLGLLRRLEADAVVFAVREGSALSALVASNLRLFPPL